MSSWYARSTLTPSNTRNKDALVTVKLSGDLGNRIFQILAGQHFAEKTGRKFLLERKFIQENPPETAEQTAKQLVHLFPDLQSYDGPPVEWNIVQEEAYMMFQYQPDIFKKFPGQHIVLDGYFFHSNYFPKSLPTLSLSKRLPVFFLHILLGDVNLKNYYRDAITIVQTVQKDARFLVFSDDPKNADLYLNSLNLGSLKYTISTTTNALDTLKEMASCMGGICANTSLSWFGAFFQKPRGLIYMPSLWMRGLARNQTNGFFPPWVTVIDVRETRETRR